jgi:voltage-gated sodium channel
MSKARVVAWCKRVSESGTFHTAVVVVILANAVLVGLETSGSLVAAYRPLFSTAHGVVLALFIAELALRAGAHGFRLLSFLRDGWNTFDFLVVALSLLPGVGMFATVARIARVVRVARLVSVSPKLRLIVGTMMRSIPSLVHVSVLLGLLLYVYAVIGVNLFGAHDPPRWGSLGAALLTLFQMLTLEGWVEVQEAVMAKVPAAWIYFSSFVVVAVFVVVNLFIAVVLNNLDEIREEDRQAALAQEDRLHSTGEEDLQHHLTTIRANLDRLEAAVRRGAGTADATAHPPPRSGPSGRAGRSG